MLVLFSSDLRYAWTVDDETTLLHHALEFFKFSFQSPAERVGGNEHIRESIGQWDGVKEAVDDENVA